MVNEDEVVMRVTGNADDGNAIIGQAKGNESVNEGAGVSVGDKRIYRIEICVFVGTRSDCDMDGVFAWLKAEKWKCMGRGGEIQGRLWPRNPEERAAAIAAGYDLDRVLTTHDLVQGDNCFFAATGITDGELLRGVRYDRGGARTQSLVMRSRSGTTRLIDARHRIDKLKTFASIDYE